MPYVLKPNKIFVKNPEGTGFLPQNVIADETAQDIISQVEGSADSIIEEAQQRIAASQDAVDEVETRAQQVISDAHDAVDSIEAQKDAMIASIASIAGQGTDTTLTQSGVAADAKATGDAVGDLKSALDNSDSILIGRYNLLNTVSWTDGKYIKGDGSIGDNTSYTITEKIYLDPETEYTILFEGVSGYTRVCAYNSDDSVNQLLINASGATGKITRTFTFPTGANYLLCSLVKTGNVYGIIKGKSVDAEIDGINTALSSLSTNSAVTQRAEQVLINCTKVMSFNTSATTLTIPKNWYLTIGKNRYDYESTDTVINYGTVSGNSVAIVSDLSGNLSAISPTNINFSTMVPLFIFGKNNLTNPATNNIFYPYYVNGTLYNAVENNRREAVYVNGSTGADTNAGTSSAPYATIQKGIDSNAKKIYVARGTYNETVTLTSKTDMQIVPTGMPTFSTSQFDIPMIVVNQVDIRSSKNIIFRDIHANNPGSGKPLWYIENCDNVTFDHCWASNGETGGFVTTNLNGRFLLCKAWDIGDATHYNSDGFNLHGYGTTELIDCVAHDCVDDGISHHDGCVASIKGGEFWNCTGGGGIAPANRYIEIDDVYCHDNAYGIISNQTDPTLYDPYILIKNSVMKNNTQKDFRIGEIACKVLRCTFDTKTVPSGAQYVEIS